MNANILKTLTALELAAAASPILTSLDSIAKGDGSIASVTGQGIALEGNIIAMLPQLQKVGITNLAAFLHTALSNYITSNTPVTPPKAV